MCIRDSNYGEVAGLPEAKALFAEILGCKSEQVFVGGNASLQLMYDAISKAFTHGLLHSEQPWSKPVSYTHLDVYKRQHAASPSSPSR